MIISLPSRRTVHFWRELSAIIPNIDSLYYCIIMANEDEILTYKPLAADSTVSANPHIPSVSASAVLGESDSVRCVLYVVCVYDCVCYLVIKLSFHNSTERCWVGYDSNYCVHINAIFSHSPIINSSSYNIIRCQMIIQYAKDTTFKRHPTPSIP